MTSRRTRAQILRAILLGVALGSLLIWVLRGASRPGVAVEVLPEPVVGAGEISSTAKVSTPIVEVAPELVSRPPPNRGPDTASGGHTPIPFRFIGRMGDEGESESALVFFGRGRTITLRGPGPLDDEYFVDAILEDQILLRHVPSSHTQFLQLTQRETKVAVPASLDEYPQD